jgi:OOP family OmpA-OmpF porin
VDLSQRRADAVRRYLMDAGVDGGRLEAKGFGPDKPQAPNITGAGRAKNRRVEFHILKRAE